MKTRIRTERLLVVLFLSLLAAPALIQSVLEWRGAGSVQALTQLPRRLTAADLRDYEDELEEASWVGQHLRPWIQYAQFAWLKDGGEKALVARDGWLFYKPGFRYLVERTAEPPDESLGDPATAIADFRDQLSRRGIQLLVVLAPNKETIYPEMLSRRADGTRVLVGEPTRRLLLDLAEAGVEVVNLCEVFEAAKRQGAATSEDDLLYLKQDTHWSPAGVTVAARAIAQRLIDRGWASVGSTHYDLKPVRVSRLGDLIEMLQVPEIATRTAPETIVCQQVCGPETGPLYTDDPRAEILVMGDSFLRIYQQDEPGAAGFIAHLAQELQQPLTSLVSDGGASTLVRQELHRRAELLQGKRVVVWEFVERDIRFGLEGWQVIALPR